MTRRIARPSSAGLAAAIACVVVLTVTGCSDTDDDPAQVEGQPSETPAEKTAEATYGVPDYEDPDGRERESPTPSPIWDDDSRERAVDVAERAVTAFAQPDASHDEWWAEFGPLLSPAAQTDYIHVDPANIPVTERTGPGQLGEDRSAYLASVEVPTDVGTYTLLLSRTDQEAPWLVDRLQPPEDMTE